MQKSPSGCFSRFGCFSLLIIALALAYIFANWHPSSLVNDHPFTIPISLPKVPSLPSLFSQSISHAAPIPTVTHEGYRVTSKPTVSPQFINRVLAFSHSPAAGLGQSLYEGGISYGIDPAFALAIFQHESSFGTQGMARETLSLGNLRCIDGTPCDQGYARFASWQQGFLTFYHLIRTGYVAHGLVTVEQIIPVYAPSSDGNDVAGYIAAVHHALAVWQDGQVQG